MPVALSPEAKKQAVASIQRYCAENLDADLGTLQATLLLEFFLKEIAPSIYNAAVGDAEAYLRDRLADLEGTCYAPEFAYWPQGSSVRRK